MIWPTVKLGDCVEIISGATPSTSVKENWDGDIFWATPKDLSSLRSKNISKTERQITKKGLDSCSAQILPKNSVLFSSARWQWKRYQRHYQKKNQYHKF